MARGRRSRAAGPKPRRPLKGRPWIWVLGFVVLAVLGLGAFMAREASSAKNALDEASQQAKLLQQQVTDGDAPGATRTLSALQRSTRTARTNTDGALWDGLAKIPYVGPNVEAVQVISASLDDIARRGMPPVVKVSSSLDADVFKPKDGRLDLATLQQLAPSVATASQVLTTNRNKILDIEQDNLVGPLKGPAAELTDKITSAQSAASSAAQAMQLAPQMLGVDKKRTYLLIFQNNAEVRSTGGLPGAFAIIEADKGKLEFVRQGSATTDIPQYEQPFVKLTKGERQVYGQLMARDFRDINFTPDFPRTAAIARAMVNDKLGIKVDGVLSIDPVALGFLLKGTGPIEAAADTTLTSENAVDILLNDVYARYANPLEQDVFFADSAKRIFEAVTSGVGDSRTVLEQLAKSADEHRILLWSARKSEQAELAPTKISGAFPAGRTGQPQLGVYLNDSTASKMQYYLDVDVAARSVRCTSQGAQTIQLTTTYTSTAPADAAELPEYITGTGSSGPQGNMVLDTRTFAPSGGRFVSFTLNDKFRPNNGVTFKGRPVNFAAFSLKPGAKVTVEATIVTAPNQRGDAVLSKTPGVQSSENGITVPSSCS
ncbi:DUF4012 domain-containing protein [Aeromicrobium sp.]|uniref:DUF4012 domain-containing protein n=1 Tax=Aeromicrobium sp. TaxID=1871063 RepID=UPI002FC7E3D3